MHRNNNQRKFKYWGIYLFFFVPSPFIVTLYLEVTELVFIVMLYQEVAELVFIVTPHIEVAGLVFMG